MGEAKRRASSDPKFRDIKAGAYPCVYCGGSALGRTVEHMPPRSFFDGKRRPNELIFPACDPCNRGSSDLDQIIALLGRFYAGVPAPEHRHEFPQLLKVVRENYPEVYVAFQARPKTSFGGEDLHPFYFDSAHVIRCINLFGAKLGLALHWRETGRVIPDSGGVLVKIYTNADAITGIIPSEIWDLFSDLRTLEQGKFHVRSQFEFQSLVAEDVPASLHFAGFRSSFAILALAVEDVSTAPRVEESLILRPGCIRGGYPYGLPRMSSLELVWRFAEQRRSFDEN